MSPEPGIESSRANGAFLDGPPTPEAKRRSCRGAERHGVYSHAILIHGESAERFEALRAGYLANLQPVGKIEEYLVDRLVACQWRIDRMTTLEGATLDHRMDCQHAAIEEALQTIAPSTRASIALQAIADNSTSLATCRRFETALVRQYEKASRQLAEWQKNRKILEKEPSPKNEHLA